MVGFFSTSFTGVDLQDMKRENFLINRAVGLLLRVHIVGWQKIMFLLKEGAGKVEHLLSVCMDDGIYIFLCLLPLLDVIG